MEQVEIVNGLLAAEGAEVFSTHFADKPISSLPKLVVRMLLRNWSKRRDVFFLIGRIDGRFAGFVFAQSAGSRPWRVLLRDPLIAAPFGFLALVSDRLRRFGNGPNSPPLAQAAPDRTFPPLSAAPPYCREGRIGAEAANIEFIFVLPQWRGRKVAAQLLSSLADRLQQENIGCMMAYISPWNRSSIAAFQSSKWNIFQLSPRILRSCYCMDRSGSHF